MKCFETLARENFSFNRKVYLNSEVLNDGDVTTYCNFKLHSRSFKIHSDYFSQTAHFVEFRRIFQELNFIDSTQLYKRKWIVLSFVFVVL